MFPSMYRQNTCQNLFFFLFFFTYSISLLSCKDEPGPGRQRPGFGSSALGIVCIRARKMLITLLNFLFVGANMKKISIYEIGIISTSLTDRGELLAVSRSVGSSSSSRGRISSFSASSRRRLREFLISRIVRYPSVGDLPGLAYPRVGCTLTLPWVWSDSYIDDFRAVVHRFRVAWLRRFPTSGAVFRVELQQRGAPHLHIIAYHPVADLPSLHDDYLRLWVRSVGTDLRGGDFLGFLRHGIDIDLNVNVIGAIRYLCDHASKGKQAQLGYKGRQWGVWGSDNFSDVTHDSIVLDDLRAVLLGRFVRRVLRFRVLDPLSPFGSRLSRRCRVDRRVSYVSPSAIRRYLSWLDSSGSYSRYALRSAFRPSAVPLLDWLPF